ncbi:deoxycytidylate deaminase [Photobacterium leiognathi]|uniref:deoxycytidylate deaminase n=1 Tax=Photobacterium leiognathi TaxID=553611 RepID=UPI002981514C|nr:deaminase [Photobacterium leiognathi]
MPVWLLKIQIEGGFVGKLLFKQKSKLNKWDERFCRLAEHVSVWSKDKTKVGAVLFSQKGGDITIGYNGFPMGVEDSVDRLMDTETKLEFVVHAEVNAIIAAGSRARGATLYVWGKPICSRCAGPIIQAGIKKVVSPKPSLNTESKWDKSGQIAEQMFKEAGIEIQYYREEECENNCC